MLKPLTPLQFRLLADTFLKSVDFESADGLRLDPITWSPKRYLGRSPTKAETATLLKRMAALEQAKLISREGRETRVTVEGIIKLHEYLRVEKQRGKYTDDMVTIWNLLIINDLNERMAILENMRKVLDRHKIDNSLPKSLKLVDGDLKQITESLDLIRRSILWEQDRYIQEVQASLSENL